MERPQNIQVVVADQDWLNVEVLRSNFDSLDRLNECCFVTEGKKAIQIVENQIDTALSNHNFPESGSPLQPIKFMLLSSKMIDMTGLDIMIAIKKLYKEKSSQTIPLL